MWLVGLWRCLSCGWWPAPTTPPTSTPRRTIKRPTIPWPSRWSMTLTGAGVMSISAPSDLTCWLQSVPTPDCLQNAASTTRCPHYRRLAITDEASPLALRSTRNRLRKAVRRGASDRTSQARYEPPLCSPGAAVALVPMRAGCQAAAWKRTRAWSARPVTRSGPTPPGACEACSADAGLAGLGRRW
jgi:hypothetical protein